VGAEPERKPEAAERVAVLDLGSNSTRHLVADIADGAVCQELARGSEVTRLMRGVDLTGQLSSEAIEEVCAAIGSYTQTWEPLEVDRVIAHATSAVREASNGDAFLAELRERFDISPRVLSGEDEAQLTYRGATVGRDGGPTLVVDIGGGSTELIVGRGEEVSLSASIQVGVVRQTERHLKQDPPSAAELEELADEVRGTIDEGLGDQPLATAEDGIGVAGTATSLGGIDLELEPYDPERVHGHRISLERIQRIGCELASQTTEERKQIPGLHPGRAPTIVAGCVILTQVMRAFGLDEIEISERDLLHGAALEAVAAPA
jgi:exopolyphosphatase / guanosine-5'-triphosphate,3'-diphosphate pyrophosphatase